MNNKILYHQFPPIDNMLNVYLHSGKYNEILPEWHGGSSEDYHIVVATSDDETAEFYRSVKEKSNEYVEFLNKRLPENEPWDIELKPLFRFDTVKNAERFLSLLTPFDDEDDRNEFIFNLRLDYDDGWKPVRVITDTDFDDPTGFLSEY